MASNCVITSGRGEEACKNSVGGINAVYFFNPGTAYFTVDPDTGYCTAISQLNAATGGPTPGTPATAYKYVSRHGSSFDQTITANPENGTVFFDQITNLVLKRLDAQTSKEVKLLAWSTPKMVILDNSGKSWLAGRVQGNDITGGTIATGTAKGDLAGYTLNFSAQEKEPAWEILGGSDLDPFQDDDMEVDVIETCPEIDITGITAGDGSMTTPGTGDTVLNVSVNCVGNYELTTDTKDGQFYVATGTASAGAGTITMIPSGTAMTTAGTYDFTISAVSGTISGTTTFQIIIP